MNERLTTEGWYVAHGRLCRRFGVVDIKHAGNHPASASHASRWLKKQAEFRRFEGWQDGYGAFTVSFSGRGLLIEYIKSQAEHHRMESLLDEYRRLLGEHGVPYDERYLA